MHVIWKRPDGFHGAIPSDYQVVELDGQARLWLHNKNIDQYPFRISGGWEEVENTVKLNNLINLIPKESSTWLEYVVHTYNHSMKSNPKECFYGLHSWLGDLKEHLKGDTWEIDIMVRTLDIVRQRLDQIKDDFFKRISP